MRYQKKETMVRGLLKERNRLIFIFSNLSSENNFCLSTAWQIVFLSKRLPLLPKFNLYRKRQLFNIHPFNTVS